MHTPVTSSADNVLTEKREVFLAENGPARIIETSQPHGSRRVFVPARLCRQTKQAAKDELTNYVKAQYLAEKLDLIDRSDPTDLSEQFQLILEVNRAKRGVTDLNVAVAAVRFEGLFSRLPADLRQRENEEDQSR